MAMREAVAVDFMGVGAGGSPDGSSEERVRLVRPIPSGGQARRSPAPEGGRESGHPFASQGLYGLRQQPWNRVPVAGRFQADEDHKALVSPKRVKESTDDPLNAHHPPLAQWDNSAPASPSHHPAGNASRYDEFLRMQQARKVAAMYAGHHQASRGMQNAAARTSPFRDEAQRGAQSGPDHLATQSQPPSNQGGFGSPAPFYGRARQASGAENGAAAMGGKRPPLQQHPFQAGNLPSHGLARPAGAGKQPRTAQLTIFYAGMVNVYDDVPLDKAQAIMLLAGSGNTWSSNYKNPPGIGAAGRPFSAPMAVPQSTTASTPGSPAPQAPTTSAAAATRPVVPGVVFSNARQAPIQNVELPQARKASLARFLEKRKDRVRKVPVKEEGDASPSRDRSPGPSVGKPASRSPSPSRGAGGAAAAQDQRSSPGDPRHQAGASSCSEPGSPTRPPGTPPRESVSEERSGGTPKRRDYDMERNANKRARSGRSPRRPGGESAAEHAMEDDSSSR